MAKNTKQEQADEKTTRYDPVSERTINHEGRIGYTWRFFPEEAKVLDGMIEKAGYTDRTSWFREVVLKLPPHERASKAPAKKPAKKGDKKGGKKAPAAPAKTRKSKADIGAPEEPAADAAEQ